MVTDNKNKINKLEHWFKLLSIGKSNIPVYTKGKIISEAIEEKKRLMIDWLVPMFILKTIIIIFINYYLYRGHLSLFILCAFLQGHL